MKIASTPTWLLPCLLGGLAFATPALAQKDDDPYAYPDDEVEPSRDIPRRRPARPERDVERDFRHSDEDEDEKKKDYERLAGVDDPNTGIAFEVLGGAMWLSSAQGQLIGDLKPAVGGRFTWEYGRLLNVEALREALWLDARYTYAGQRDGTTLIVGDTRLHYATLAPAYELTFGEGSNYGVFAQVGGGIAYEHTTLEVGGKPTSVDGIKPLIQYGVGVRGRTPLSIESNVRLAWRLELTRFRRGYQDDTYLGASAGVAF